jgi:hypothetical protein
MKRTFRPNGKVDPQYHFFVSPEEWNLQHLIPQLLSREFIALVAPGQSGKSTRVDALQKQLLATGDILPIYVDLSWYQPNRSESFYTQFVRMMQDNILKTLMHKVDITATDFATLFREEMSDKCFLKKQVILLIDEIDILAKVPEINRMEFTTSLRAYKQATANNCLRSCLVVTNYIGSYFHDTLGTSLFNVSNTIDAPYFSLDDIRMLFKQYTEQESISIDKRIITDIFLQTSGAQGLVAMYGKGLDEFRGQLNRSPTFSEWFSYCNSKLFHTSIISVYPNYKKMIQYVKRADIQVILMKKIYGSDLPLDISEDIYRVNIFNINNEFANPFVRQMIADCFHTIPESPKYYEFPLDSTNSIDFLKLVRDSIQFINPLEILGAPIKKQNKCNKNVKPGPKEVVYVLVFKRAVEKLLQSIRVSSIEAYPEVEVEKQSCDMVLKILGQTIAVEHGANLIVSASNEQPAGIIHHVKKQAEIYHEGLNANQTWVINWTNVPTGTGYYDVMYHFPHSATVNTLYVYHDELFSTVKLVTKDKTIEVKTDPNQNIERLDSGEPLAKRMRYTRADMSSWNIEEVRSFISNLKAGFAAYGNIFSANEIDGDGLLIMDNQTLIDLGVTVVGHRMKILSKIQQLKGE